ncbi:hypothetical protein FBY35_3053 [Streptomyces sp. SLBN-118]|uniref:hypothetical protein n=1 Tax=Streptomyces sp. SLBN-118 TaxID=2768454 RepID=UPI001153F340|nr:hypothetical protein [Streptomyces sp. SLBN-118]TQK52610.1 hypothetical protein FBY35_3053 [Streptomyces sp. SLBN-118]
MSPENRTKSTLGPLPKRRAWMIGSSFASLALVVAGLATPAIALQSATPSSGSVVAGPSGVDCDDITSKVMSQMGGGGGNHDHCGFTGPTGPTGPRGETGPCNDIDSYNPLVVTPVVTTHQISAALFDPDGEGPLEVEAFAGIRTVPGGTYTWTDISNNEDFPDDACSISVSSNGLAAGLPTTTSVQVLTRYGVVWETSCTQDFLVPTDPVGTLPALTCAEGWTQVVDQP